MILVTGGAGFIGSVLVHELNKRGIIDIVIVDRLRDSSKWLNLRGARYERYIHADELFSREHEKLLMGVSCIYHLGACSATTERNVDYLMKNNVEYSMKLFDWAIHQEIKIIYASSAATYGDGEHGYADNHEKISSLLPLNPYGYSKRLFDEWVLKRKRFPPAWFGLKFFNVFGPHEYHKGHMSSVIYHAYKQVQQEGKLALFRSYRPDVSDGEQKRDFIYVKDVARLMIELMNLPSIQTPDPSGIYNVGSGKAQSFNELALCVFKALNKKPLIEYIDMPEHLINQYQYWTEADMNKLKTVVKDWKPLSLEAATHDYIKSHLTRSNPYLGL